VGAPRLGTLPAYRRQGGTRGRSDYSSDPLNRLSFGRLPLEPIMYVMSRKMLLEIKHLAEAGDQVTAGPQ
jgi:hypothetical protein